MLAVLLRMPVPVLEARALLAESRALEADARRTIAARQRAERAAMASSRSSSRHSAILCVPIARGRPSCSLIRPSTSMKNSATLGRKGRPGMTTPVSSQTSTPHLPA